MGCPTRCRHPTPIPRGSRAPRNCYCPQVRHQEQYREIVRAKRIERWIDETHVLAERRIDERDQAGPLRRGRTRTVADDRVGANLYTAISAGNVRVAGDVGHTATLTTSFSDAGKSTSAW